MTLLVATGSAHKIAELSRILAAESVGGEILGLADVPPYEEPVESGRTFEENALIKARAGHEATGLATLADDSGIEVDVLNKMPGVRSARWAGPHGHDGENLALLLRQIADVPESARTARFRCAMALVWTEPGQERPREIVVEGTVEGTLTDTPRGDHGFGYDPIFLPLGESRTTAEMGAEDKDAISHRGRALRAMVPHLRDVLHLLDESHQEDPHAALS